MNGGPSQVDTFDPKPELTRRHGEMPGNLGLKTEPPDPRSLQERLQVPQIRSVKSRSARFSPEIGTCIDDICVVRSMHTNLPNHEPGLLLMTSGNPQPIRPSMGSWITYGLGTENQNLPGFVVMCPGKPVVGPQALEQQLTGNLPGMLRIRDLDPKKVIEHIRNNNVVPDTQRAQLDLLNELNSLHKERRPGDDHDARIQSLEIAYRCSRTPRTPLTSAANRSVSARRTARGTSPRPAWPLGGWSNGASAWSRSSTATASRGTTTPTSRMDIARARDTDRPIAALIRDLKARGLLDETLILWGGEFGRTPTAEGSNGRSQQPRLLEPQPAAVKRGLAYGATDEFGFAAVEKKVHVHDLHATILHLMGLDHEKLTYRYSGRDFRLTDVHGVVVKDILR